MRFSLTVRLVFSALALAALSTLAALAQTATTGAIVGSVTDRNGAVLSGAEIEIANTATNQVVKATTNKDGQYIFPAVLPGEYNISCIKQGFRKASVNTFKVDVARSYTINLIA